MIVLIKNQDIAFIINALANAQANSNPDVLTRSKIRSIIKALLPAHAEFDSMHKELIKKLVKKDEKGNAITHQTGKLILYEFENKKKKDEYNEAMNADVEINLPYLLRDADLKQLHTIKDDSNTGEGHAEQIMKVTDSEARRPDKEAA